MNLCANAAQAMRETGGVLTVSLSETKLDDASAARFANLQPGKYNLLTVSDTGSGMDEKVMARIFDPFFTTKSRDQGTGLGLAVVHGIITRHKGEITVSSQPGCGSIFNIYLPVVEEETNAEIELETPLPLGRENILFVDDEEALVEIGRGILERLGYRVVAKTSGLEALEVFKTKPDGFDLVITDQTMPKLSGFELAAELKKIRPDLPVILCTGYSDQVSPERLETAGIEELIMKPIPVRELAETVRRLLDRRQQ